MNSLQVCRRGALLVAILLSAIFILFVVLHVHADSRTGFYANCTEAEAHHDTNIPSTSWYYRPQLDRNHDGIACQR